MTGRRTPAAPLALIATGVLATVLALGVTTGLASPFGSRGPDLAVSSAFMPQPVTTKIAGAYLTVTNTGDAADELTSVNSDLTADITMHQSVGDEMRQMTSLAIPAHGSLELARGGSHLMLMGLDRKPVEGNRVSVTLHFAKTSAITLDIPVEAPTFNPKQDHAHEQ